MHFDVWHDAGKVLFEPDNDLLGESSQLAYGAQFYWRSIHGARDAIRA